jgi:hypothetical protein
MLVLATCYDYLFDEFFWVAQLPIYDAFTIFSHRE